MLLDEIVKGLNINKSIFLKGKSLYEEKKIKNYNFNLIPNSTICLFFATIEEEGNLYNLSLDIRNRKINYFKCACHHYHDSNEICEHLVAFSFFIFDKLGALNLENDDKAIDDFIKKFTLNDRNFNNDHLLDLKPLITVNSNFMDLELKIGTKKHYTVKNIMNLLQDIENKNTIRYGKEVETNHDIVKFNKKSVDLILYLNSLKKMYDGFYNKYVMKNSKIIRLIEFDIDNFMDTFKKYSLDFILNGSEYNLRYSQNLKYIEMKLGRTSLELNKFSEYILLETKKRLYLFNEACYSQIEKTSENEILVQLIKLIFELRGKISFDENKGESFYQKVIPILKENIDIFIENEEKYQYKEFSAKTYIDLEDGLVTCKNEIYYDQILDEKQEISFLRNTFLENKLKNCFMDYGFNFKNNFYYINLERIVNDFKIFVDQLHSVTEVYVSDTLKDVEKKIIRKLNLSISTRMNSNLLQLNFNDHFSKDHLDQILLHYRKKKRYYILNENEIIDLSSDDVRNLDQMFEDLDLQYNEILDRYEMKSYKLLMLSQYKNDFKIDFSRECLEFLEKLKNYKSLKYPINDSFKNTLKNFQLEGYHFLKLLAEYHFGGILADEMGLGKTIQTLALIDNDAVNIPSLIVCPTSLVYNWESEIIRFAPNLNCKVIHGLQTTRKYLIDHLSNKDIGIISYDTLRIDYDKFASKKFRFVILDEAQNIKNFKALKSLAVKNLDAEVRFALTGTPIENYLSDLWSIFDFILPGYLKDYNDFKNEYESYIMENDHKERGKSLVKKVTPFILRRTKKEVLKELPDKFETRYFAKMDDEQNQLYKAYHLDILNKMKEDFNPLNVLQGITKLRQICADPNLIFEDYGGGSCKLELCTELIKEYIGAGHKILVFSSFSSMLSNLLIALNKEGISTLKLTGETKVKERLELVELFNHTNQYQVFLISLKAGGVGLNLTSSDVVIHYDPWWNVQAESQATDRSHRIGQQNQVEVIKLIVKGTIEEKIIQLQETKKELSDLILDDQEITKEKLSSKDLMEILR